MQRIFKYPLELKDKFTLAMPEGAQALHAEVQQETPCLWALVDDEASLIGRTFRIVGTGHPIEDIDTLHYINTFQQPPFVWHLFEVSHD